MLKRFYFVFAVLSVVLELGCAVNRDDAAEPKGELTPQSPPYSPSLWDTLKEKRAAFTNDHPLIMPLKNKEQKKMGLKFPYSPGLGPDTATNGIISIDPKEVEKMPLNDTPTYQFDFDKSNFILTYITFKGNPHDELKLGRLDNQDEILSLVTIDDSHLLVTLRISSHRAKTTLSQEKELRALNDIVINFADEKISYPQMSWMSASSGANDPKTPIVTIPLK